jgi:hypothetical protein
MSGLSACPWSKTRAHAACPWSKTRAHRGRRMPGPGTAFLGTARKIDAEGFWEGWVEDQRKLGVILFPIAKGNLDCGQSAFIG